jgi:ABC-type lipoprotein release transport system permease subunit
MRPWIEKQRNILDFALSSLARRKGKNIALVTVYTLLVVLLASVMFFTHALRREAVLVLKDSPAMIVQRLAAGRQELVPRHYAGVIAAIRGVSGVHGRLWGYYFDPVAGANYTLLAEETFDHPPGSIVIGRGVSRARAIAPGEMLPLRGYNGQMSYFTVAGLLTSDSELVSSDLMVMSQKDFRKLFHLPDGLYTDIVLDVRNSKEMPVVAAKITALLPDTRPITRAEVLRTYNSIFDWRSGIVVVILSAVALAFIIFAWDKASGLSAEEKKEIGVLKAIGWETADVLWLKFWEGTVLSLTSFLAGILLAYVHVFLTSAALFEPVLKGWSVLYPEFRLVPHIEPYQLATLFFLTVVPYTVATIIPSWRAATIDPDAVMRS